MDSGPSTSTEVDGTGEKNDMHPTYININELAVVKELGSGAFGEVFLYQWRNRQEVAVKFPKLRPKSGDPEEEAWYREVCAQWGLNHPNVITFLGLCESKRGEDENGEAKSVVGIVLEYAEGGSLRSLLRTNSLHIPEDVCLMWTIQMAEGMRYLHEHHVLHLDFKPENILITGTSTNLQERVLKLSDFGLARLNFTGTLVMSKYGGTPYYSAPEVLQGYSAYEKGKCSTYSDVWSYGIVLWELVTRKPLHEGVNPIDVLYAIKNESLAPTIPKDCKFYLREIMTYCFKADYHERWSFHRITSYLNGISK